MRLTRHLAPLVFLGAVAAGCSAGAAAELVPSPPPTATAPAPTPAPSREPSPEPVATAPLTGEGSSDVGVSERPVLAVKIENTAAARPQAGLDQADIVYEELVEGGVTRFLALFQSEVPEIVGPVRSARLVDVDVLPAYRGILAYSGARDEVTTALQGSGIVLLVDDGGDAFTRDPGRSRSHDLMADGGRLYEKGLERGGAVAAHPVFRHSDEPPAGAVDCPETAADCGTALDVRMSGAAIAGWSYDEAHGVYRRSQNGTPSVVVGEGRIGAANVVQLAMDVGPGGCCDAAGSSFTATRVFGEGDAVVLRDGARYHLRWRKTDAAADLELLAADGTPFPLARGATWIHLAPRSAWPG